MSVASPVSAASLAPSDGRGGVSAPIDPGQVRIGLRGLRVHGYHGVLPSERENGQDFVIDLDLIVGEPDSDELTRTVNYASLAEEVAAIVAGEAVNLIETLAARIADHCVAYPSVLRTQVTVHKPQAPIDLEFGDVTATVNRSKI